MRDIGLIIFFVACIPYMLRSPATGVVMWIWLSVMNPHRLSYGFAYDLQFALATAVITFIALAISKEEKRLALTPPVVVLGLFMLWMCITSLVPFHPGDGYAMWSRVMKILLMTFVALAVIHTKKQIHWVVWTIVFSLAFYGAKGGLFTLLTGGSYLVWGPAGSFIEGNNEVALAFVMIIPLIRYVQLSLTKRWQKLGMTAVALLTALAAIGSHSRGALVAIASMALFLWWKSRNKVAMAFVLVTAALVMTSFMPAAWFNRMHTIQSYDEDSSAMGRINAWWMAFNMACDRPLGGGYEIYDFETFARYAPNPLDVHAAHSIYFQILGEHGFVGFFLFVSIGALTWTAAGDAKRKAKGIEELAWAGALMDMTKVSMVGYAVGGAFLSLAYFDVPYYLMVIVVATRALVIKTAKGHAPARVSDRMDRGRRFGSVAIADEPTEPEEALARPPRGNWRGQGAYTKPSLN